MGESQSKLNLSGSPARSLFLGNILEENLFPFPAIRKEEAETLRMVIDSLDKCLGDKGEDFRSYDRDGVQPEDYINSLKELGLFGLIIPEEYGGIGLSNAGYARVLQASAKYDGSTSLTVGAHSSIGMKGLLLFGTEAQKKKYLPKLASGEWIASFCLTEAGAGSDAASVKTAAVKNADGSWTLNGEKIWITNGAFAKFFTVFARTGQDHGKMSAFIVERDFPGVSTGPKEDKMGIRASATTTVRFDNVKVPAENLLGEEGKGFKLAMAILNNGRTGLGGGAVGAMKASIARAVKQSLERKQFGRSISEFTLVKEKIARMTVLCFATESVVNMVAHYIDSGVEDYSIEAAISKVFASEALWTVANEALQIAGGNGFMRDFPYERVVRDSRINLIFEGTNEILRLYIALTGMKDAGAYLKEIGAGASKIFNDPIKGFGVLSGYAAKRMTRLTSLGRDRIEAVPDELRGDATAYEKYTLKLAAATDAVLKKYGKNIVGTQLTTKRLADSVIDLFVGLCVISRVSSLIAQKGAANCKDEIKISELFAREAVRHINQNLRRIEKNEDPLTVALANSVLANGYRWDVV